MEMNVTAPSFTTVRRSGLDPVHLATSARHIAWPASQFGSAQSRQRITPLRRWLDRNPATPISRPSKPGSTHS